MPTNSEDAPAPAGGFPAAERADWMERVAGVLTRGRDGVDQDELGRLYTRVLRTPTHEGITLEPLYTSDDAPPPGSEGLPGFAPFVRGARAMHAGPGWDVRQSVTVRGDGADARGRALEELESGAVSVLLDLREADAIDTALLDRMLDGVALDAAPVGLCAGPRALPAAAALRALWSERGVTAPAAGGSLGVDPIGAHALAGGAGDDLGDALEATGLLTVTIAATHSGVRTITVDGAVYHAAGGSHAQQLGAALATGVAYLRALDDAGLGAAVAARQIEFRLAAGAEQFPAIAALRAFRRLWARVGEVLGVEADAFAARIHAVSADAMLTRYDPWVNLLRGTVACFAAGVGGAEVITIAPYDALAESPGGLGRRMARNTQALLIDESGVGRVMDPAGGSYFVERLTEQLADAAWAVFQDIEASGGMVAALEAGLVQRLIADTWHERLGAIARRRDPVTGVSEFPAIDEPVPAPAADADRPAATPFPALAPVRYAAPFEDRRARADRHEAATGARPAVFLATLGTAAQHTARATFAKNLFEVAGIRAVDAGDLDEGDDIGAAFAASGARLACICSTDAVYAQRAAAAARALAGAGAVRVYLAGRPGDIEPQLREAGVHEFAYVGVDALDLLTRALDAAGVA